MSNLVDRSTKKTQLKYPFSSFSILSNSVFQVSIISTAPVVALTPFQNDKKIDNLIDIIQSLAFSICTLQRIIGTSSIVA